MFRKLFYRLPISQRYFIRRALFFPIDLWENITGTRPELVPPKGMIFTGSGNFVAQGDTFLEYFKEYANLKPNHRVLDVGSGIGRMARPLTRYLSSGSYEGFDVVETGVTWCKENITKEHSNFNFTYVELKNDLYTDSGADASIFKFPYEDNSFDLVFLTSVFTHMVAHEVEHYMQEIARVLKPGGKVFSTFFILSDASKKHMIGTDFEFKFKRENHTLMDDKVTAANVAYEEHYLKNQLLEENGFTLKHFLPGSWSSAPNSFDFQDIVVAEKTT